MKIKSVTFYSAVSHFHGPLSPDMLRYDQAFVNPACPNIVAYPTFSGQNRKKPTFDRWRSFGFVLTKVVQPDQWSDDPSNWTTRVHPRKGSMYGPTDYERLMPVSLDRFLSAKNIHQVISSVIVTP